MDYSSTKQKKERSYNSKILILAASKYRTKVLKRSERRGFIEGKRNLRNPYE